MKKPTVAIREFKKPKDMYACPFVKFTHKSEGVVALNCDGYVVLWDSETTKMLNTFQLSKASYGPSVWTSRDRLTVAISGGNSTFLINTKTLEVATRLPFGASNVVWSKNGELIAAVKPNWDSFMPYVHVYRRSNYKEIASFELPKYSEGLDFWGDSIELIFSDNSAISTWNLQEQKIIKQAAFVDNVWPIAWSDDGKTFAYRRNKKIAFLDVNTWKSHQLDVPEKADHFALSPNGKRLAMTVGNSIVIWDLEENQAWLKWKRPNYGSAISVDFSHDGQQLTCTPDHEVHVLDFRAGATDQLVQLCKPQAGEIQCLNMVGPDDRMDADGYTPLNPLKGICPKCEKVDLNAVAAPYQLVRKIESPSDFAPAVAGNFLVRESMKRVLDAVTPGQCKFYPTIHRKTKQPTAWLLAVPQHIQTTAVAKGKLCPLCGEPSDWEESEATNNPCSSKDIFKSRNMRWQGHEHFLYFSVRFETLVKRLGLRGMVRSYYCKQTPSDEDLAWVNEKLKLLKQAKAAQPSRDDVEEVKTWFKNYLQKKSKAKTVVHDFTAVEKKHGVMLPESYKEFIAGVGSKAFNNIDGEEGFRATILLPKKLEFEDCCEEGADEEETFKGILFAVTDHGDAFYFDTARGKPDYEVRKHDHEIGSFEPYAKNFAECIKRFSER